MCQYCSKNIVIGYDDWFHNCACCIIEIAETLNKSDLNKYIKKLVFKVLTGYERISIKDI